MNRNLKIFVDFKVFYWHRQNFIIFVGNLILIIVIKNVFLGFVMVVSIALSFSFKGQEASVSSLSQIPCFNLLVSPTSSLDRIDIFDVNGKNKASIINSNNYFNDIKKTAY